MHFVGALENSKRSGAPTDNNICKIFSNIKYVVFIVINEKKFWSQLNVRFLKIKNSVKTECGWLDYYVMNRFY